MRSISSIRCVVKASLTTALLQSIACGSGTASATPLHSSEIHRQLLQKQPVAGSPDLETQLWLIDYPPGAAAPTHRHPVVGLGYVIEGEFESSFGDDPIVHVKAGESFVDPARTEHRLFRNPSTQHPLRFAMVYTIPSGRAPVEF